MLAASTAAAIGFQASAQSASGTIPIVYVTTENGAMPIDKEDKVKATIWIDPCKSTLEGLGSEKEPIAFTLSGRGNYTWTGFDKKPYKIKFDKKTSVFGLPKDKTWAMLAHADDNLAFLRNTVGFELSRRLGLTWTPTQQPVEFVVNGEYRGLYFLSETIKVNPGRVDITEQDDLATTDVDGGWLVEIDNYDTDPHLELTDPNGYTIFFTYKSPEELSKEQSDYLAAQMKAIDDAIFNVDKKSTDWEKLIDIESAARYYVVQEILDDCESYHGSCYIYRDRGEGEKWKFGPVWDFGNAFQRPDKDFIWHKPAFYQVWIGELYKFESFQKKVKEVWKEFLDNNYLTLEDYIDGFIGEISQAAKGNAELWPQYGNDNLTDGSSRFKRKLGQSVDWLSNQWEYAVEKPYDIYVRGDFNSWDTTDLLCFQGNGIYTITLPELKKENCTFKVATADWSTVDLGGDGVTAVEPGVAYKLKTRGKNMSVSRDLKGCRLTLNLNESTLLVEEDASGVEGIESDSGLRIEGNVVYGDGPISVYDLTGMCVAGGDGRAEVGSRGLYIVICGEKTLKVRI